MTGLGVKFIATGRTPGFVIADHPVVAYNQFVEHHPVLSHWPAATGPAHKGIQLFLPLSPGMVLALFDPATYQYGGRSVVCRAGPNDVDAMNRMQAVNAMSCVYYAEARMDDETIGTMMRTRANHVPIYEKPVQQSPVMRRPDGKLRQLVVSWYPPIRVGAKLSFIRTLDGHSYEDYEGTSVPVRSEELIQFTEMYAQHLESIVEEGRKTLGGGPAVPESAQGSEES